MHKIMTIEEVAAYLRVSERTVYDWAHKGTIPGGKLGTTWRFRRSDIEDWVNRHLKSAARPVVQTVDRSDILARILDADRVVFVDSNRKQEALRQLGAVLSTSSLVRDPDELDQSILRREELMSTGIGFGVGVPHVRIDSVGDLVMALGIAREPIADYASLDEVPVQIVCMVAARSNQHPEYIRALSAISSRLKLEAVRAALVQAADVAEAHRLFTGIEG